MSHITVKKVRETDQSRPFLQETIDLFDHVRRRAFELFQSRGGAPGNDMEDWLRAEGEVFQVPRMELAERDEEFQLQIAVPGFDSKDIRVTALPDAVIVEGETTHQHRETKGHVRICEFGERRVFREIPLPEPVDLEHVSATLDKGLLEIHAAKAIGRHNKNAA